ncbi:TPA: type II secretion system protein, partial [Clostridioides difficile]|nr:type II secretion system protein [Clostridioides difficile]
MKNKKGFTLVELLV